MLDQLDQGLGLVGGADAAFGWVGDTAIVVNDADGTPEGGVIIAPTDKDAADRLLTALKTFLALGGAEQGVTIRDETYNGTTITIVDLGDASKLAGADPRTARPACRCPAGHLEIAIAVTDDVVVIGIRPGLRQARPRHDVGDLARLDRRLQEAAPIRRARAPAPPTSPSAAIREMVEKAMASEDPASSRQVPERRRAVPRSRSTRCSLGSSISGDLSKSVFIVTVK